MNLDGDVTTWTYDKTSQVLSERYTDSLGTTMTTFVYDPVGNRLVENDNSTITTSVYDAANRLTTAEKTAGITTYTYDRNGNQRSIETPSNDITTYTWTYENQMSGIESPSGALVTYTYAPVNRKSDELRISKDSDTGFTAYIWDDQNIILEQDDVGTVEAEYTVKPQAFGNLISQQRNTDSSYYHFDPLGSTSVLTDNTETITDSYLYSVFGEVKNSSGTTDNPYQWIGKQGYYRDSESGLYSLRKRTYDPNAGRFQSEDPLGFDAGDSNFYRYAGNNAATATDPSGLQEQNSAGGGFDWSNPQSFINWQAEHMPSTPANRDIYCECVHYQDRPFAFDQNLLGKKKVYTWVTARKVAAGISEKTACKTQCELEKKQSTGTWRQTKPRSILEAEEKQLAEREFLEDILAQATKRVINGNASGSKPSPAFEIRADGSIRPINSNAYDKTVRSYNTEGFNGCDPTCLAITSHGRTDWRTKEGTTQAAFELTPEQLKTMIEDEFRYLLRVRAENERIANYNEADEIQAQLDLLAFILVFVPIPGARVLAAAIEAGNLAISIKREKYVEAVIRAVPMTIAGGVVIGKVAKKVVPANRTVAVLGEADVLDDVLVQPKLVCEVGEEAASNAKDGLAIVKTKGADDLPVKVKSGVKKDPGEGGCLPNSNAEPYAFGSGSPQQRSAALMDEAGKATGVKVNDYVDEIIYDSTANFPHFWVTEDGVRRIVLNPRVFRESGEMQLIIGTHELEHALHYDDILNQIFKGNLSRARDAFFMDDTTYRYAVREYMTQSVAIDRVLRHLGGVSTNTQCKMLNYLEIWRIEAGIGR